MRKTIGTIVLALAAALLVPAAPAQAGTQVCHQQYAGSFLNGDGVVVTDPSATCYPDTGHCVSYFESDLPRQGMRRRTVRHLVGAAGHEVGKRAIDNKASGLLDTLGLNGADTYSAPVKYRLVKSYPTCAEDGMPATFLVEYEMHHDVGRVTRTLWI